MPTISITVDDKTHELPAKWAICPECSGAGTELRGGLKGAVFSAEDLAEDPEFFDDYFSGAYDVACSKCHGRTSVLEVDVASCTFAQMRIAARHRREARREARYRYEAYLERKAEVDFGA